MVRGALAGGAQLAGSGQGQERAAAEGAVAEVRDVAGGRREALRLALASLRPGDILAVLGKGHEAEQEIAGQRRRFLDREVLVQEALRLTEGAS